MIADCNCAAPRQWFPRLASGFCRNGGRLTETLASVAWLLMTELEAYIEDVHGARHSPALLDMLRIKIAELLIDIDCRLNELAVPDELHQFPLVLEYGLLEVTPSSGESVVQWLGIANRESPPEDEAARLVALLRGLIDAFPGTLFNPLLPANQGQVLRTLRNWDSLCRLNGRNAAFLVPLMKSL